MRYLSVFLMIILLLGVSCQNEAGSGKDETKGVIAEPEKNTVPEATAEAAEPTPSDSGKEAYAFPDIEGKHWVLSKYTYEGRQERPVGSSTIFMKVNGNVLSGNGGCNGFNGQVFLAEDGAVNISGISKTKELCGGLMIQESRFIELLEGAKTFKVNLVFLELEGPGGKLTFRNDLK